MAISQKRRPNDGAPNRMMLRRTLFLLSVCGAAAFVVLAARLYQLQIVRHDELESRAIAQQVRETTVIAATMPSLPRLDMSKASMRSGTLGSPSVRWSH